MDNTEEIKQAYYYTDIEPTLDNLHEIINICNIFINEGGDRLMCAMDMRKWDLDEIERLSGYIVQSRQKRETELFRLRKYEEDFNDMFATDIRIASKTMIMYRPRKGRYIFLSKTAHSHLTKSKNRFKNTRF